MTAWETNAQSLCFLTKWCTRDDQFIMFPNKAAFRMFCSHLQLFWGGKQERIRGVMVARFVDVFGVYVAWCCGQFFVFFGLRTGWILSSYLHPKIITSELFQINVGWFFSVPTPQNYSISMEFLLGRLVAWPSIDRGICIQLLSRLRESETARSRSPNSTTTLATSVLRRKGAGKSRGLAGC